jgi:HK97 family phage portal protein
MSIGSALARIIGPLVGKATEGQYRPGPYNLPVTGGWLSHDVGQIWNWWQSGYDPIGAGGRSAMVEACVSAYAQTVAMCPGDHWKTNSKGGRDRVKTSALSRLLRYPNGYQTISDFLLNMVRSLYLDGNAYALAVRNDRFEVTEFHLMNPVQSRAQLASTGEIFYRLGGNHVVEKIIPGHLTVPQRDVLHIKLHCQRYPYPLIGESPIAAAVQDIAAGDAMTQQQIQFYLNQARPSAVLSTDLVLDRSQTQALRDAWNEQAKGLSGGGAGGVPILTAGLKVMPWGANAKDAQLADVMKFSAQNIALAFRIPLQILGIGGTPYSSTEMLMQSWIATGLGFCLNHIEEAVGNFFDLKGQPDEWCEFDTNALLRSALKERIDSLARGVQGGIYSPNEARITEGLPEVKFGDEPRVQQQVVPLSAAAAIPAAPAPGAPPGAAPAAGPAADKPPPFGANGAKPPAAKPAAPPKQKRRPEDVKRDMQQVVKLAAKINRRYG